MKIGDIKKLPNLRGEDFTVEIVDLYDCDGIEYAEVRPVGFNGFDREVPASMLKEA